MTRTDRSVVCGGPDGIVSAEDVRAGRTPPETHPHIRAHRTATRLWVAKVCVAVGDRIGYARVSTADQDPQLQLDALSAADCLKTDTDTATKADRPRCNACLGDLRRGDTLIFWKIDRLDHNCATSSTSSPPCRPVGSGSGR